MHDCHVLVILLAGNHEEAVVIICEDIPDNSAIELDNLVDLALSFI